jgi:hypothetical protein
MKMAMTTLLGRFDIHSVDTADRHQPEQRQAFTMMTVRLRMCLHECA